MLDYIGQLDQKGVVPKQILDDVKQTFPDQSLSASTLSRILRDQRATRRDTEAWSPHEAVNGVDVSAALPALAPLIASSEGRRQRLSLAEAQRITFVRRAAPDIPIELAFRVAQMYARTTPEALLDAYLAFAPWRGDRERRAYLHAIDEEWLPRWSPQTLRELFAAQPEQPRELARLSREQVATMADDEREALEAAATAAALPAIDPATITHQKIEDLFPEDPATSARQHKARGMRPTSPARTGSRKEGGRSGTTRKR